MKQLKAIFTLSILVLVLTINSCGLCKKSQSSKADSSLAETVSPPATVDVASSTEATNIQSETITDSATYKNGFESFAFPEPVDYVNDFENLLTAEEITILAEMIGRHERNTTDQIAIITVTSIEPYETLDAYTLGLANYWGVGQKEKDNGVLMACSKRLRKVSIQNGYGIEKRMSDAETKDIIDHKMAPNFATGDYFNGFKIGVQAIIDKLQ